MAHSKVLILCCSDPRLVIWLDNYVKQYNLPPMGICRIISPGVIPALAWKLSYSDKDIQLKNIKLLNSIHQFEEIVLVTHEDCAAMGGSAKFADFALEEKAHQQMLQEAQKNIQGVLGQVKPKFTLVYVTKAVFDELNQGWHKKK